MQKLIVVTGNQGKSILSYYLGEHLSKGLGYKVAIISPNYRHNPVYTLFLDAGSKSIGDVLEQPIINQETIVKNLYIISSNLGYLCYGTGKTPNHYPKITQDNIDIFTGLLDQMVDYVIFDDFIGGDDTIRYESMINKGIEHQKIRITSADVKGISYRRSDRSDRDTIDILTEPSRYSPTYDIIKSYLHPPKYHIPYIKEFQSIYTTSSIKDIPCPHRCLSVIKKLSQEIVQS